jgi:hypothetical protein
MSASGVHRAVGVLLTASKPCIRERGLLPSAFSMEANGNGRRVNRGRPVRVGYTDAESARA